MRIRAVVFASVMVATLAACDRSERAQSALPDDATPVFRNIASPTAYVDDSTCASCHTREASAYAEHAMSRSFRQWAPDARVPVGLPQPLLNEPTGFRYTIEQRNDGVYQVEVLTAPDGRRLHELRRRMDWVMGSGYVAETYFTEENGRLFQLPLTWYRDHGWDFSPGYELNNARFDRVLPDRCIACHSSYPTPYPHLEGKYETLRPGIGCQRCHGAGALHVAERRAGAAVDTAFDNSIVNPARLPLSRRMDLCEQCHVHAPVTVLREGRDYFGYRVSQPLDEQVAFFKVTGSIDIVSHADRLRQSACFLATRTRERPLECATCHAPHAVPDPAERNSACLTCHVPAEVAQRVAQSAASNHTPQADCVSCHMPPTKQRTVPHGVFTDHWIRVVRDGNTTPTRQAVDRRIEAYFGRDRSGPEASMYQGMGGIVHATLASDFRALAEAATALSRELQSASPRADALFLLGVAHQQLGRLDDAARALEQSLRADSTHPDRLRALAQTYEQLGRDTATIDRLYQRALAMQPALAWIRADYAAFLQANGRRTNAEEQYRRALSEQPSLAVAAFNLGTVLTELARARDASAAFGDAVRLDPALGQALATLIEVRVSNASITGVRALEPPLERLLARAPPPGSAQLAIDARDASGVQFTNVAPGTIVLVTKPDGTLVRLLRADQGATLRWDLRAAHGGLLGGGVYQAQVITRGASGTTRPPQRLPFAIIRYDTSSR